MAEGNGQPEEEKILIEILDENVPIDLAKYINYVQAPSCGAVATFSGTTRDTFEGKTVLELRYEAYVPMAIRCLKSICSSARSAWDLHSIALAHRLGPVPVGESSVFIAVSAVHRDPALSACKFLIDEIKASVPIWKKEVYANGEVWKENSEFLQSRLELSNEGLEHRLLGRVSGSGGDNNRKKGCCGNKVKLDEEASDSRS
ncbi:Molybdopterin synthase [Bertholletia excelsa]